MEEKYIDSAKNWANNLLHYACASNRHILIKEYAPYLRDLIAYIKDLENELAETHARVWSLQERLKETLDCYGVDGEKGKIDL